MDPQVLFLLKELSKTIHEARTFILAKMEEAKYHRFSDGKIIFHQEEVRKWNVRPCRKNNAPQSFDVHIGEFCCRVDDRIAPLVTRLVRLGYPIPESWYPIKMADFLPSYGDNEVTEENSTKHLRELDLCVQAAEAAQLSVKEKGLEQQSKGECKVKEPPKIAMQAFRLYYLKGEKQEDIAKEMSRQYGKSINQGQVSRWINETKIYVDAGNILPELPKLPKPVTVDPDILEMGERQDRLTKRQRQQISDD